MEDNSKEEIVSIYAPEKAAMDEGTTFIDLPDRVGKIKKTATTDYTKLAKAVGDIRSKGINVSLININESSYTFKPDVKNNQIMFGLSALNRVGGDVIEKIIAGRPYRNINDFMSRCPLNKQVMISLIKAGAFDETDADWAKEINAEPRIGILAYYLSTTCGMKDKLTLQNVNALMTRNILPDELELEKRSINFTKYISKHKMGQWYSLDDASEDFIRNEYPHLMDYISIESSNIVIIKQDIWNKEFEKVKAKVKKWIVDNHDLALQQLNCSLFAEEWEKYVEKVNVSAWEMESLCFYYHEHELANLNNRKYNISNFNDLVSGDVDYYFKRGGKEIPIFKIEKIIGTVIAKNDTRHTITLLTTDGIIPVKFTRDLYGLYKKQISDYGADGKKHIVEKSWMSRGTILMIQGYRRDNQFVAKTYSKTIGHTLYRITNIYNNGKDIEMTHLRAGGIEEDA